MALIQKKIKKALYYPLSVLCVAAIIVFILLFYVLPELQSLFLDFGKQLPSYTRFILEISNQLRKKVWLLPLLIFCIFGIFQFLKTKKWVHTTPFFFKSTIELYRNARWTHTLATSLTAGIPLAQALSIVGKTMEPQNYQLAFQDLKGKIMQGKSLHTAMETTTLFPLYLRQMIFIGEQAGTLPFVLTELSNHYQVKANDQIETLLQLLEPLFILILGIIIGGIVIAMYLPIFKLGSVI